MSVLDFEPVAKAKLPPWHWAWLSTGGDGGETMRANREGFDRYQIRARRLVDISKIDTSVRLFGRTWETPIYMSPVGGHRTYNPEGELATARAAKAKKHLQVLSTVTTTSVEDVNAARGEPVWFQLYQRDDWGQTKELLKRVESAGCPALVFTVDLLGGRNMEQFNRVLQRNRQQCVACHLNGQPLTDLRNRPMLNKLSTPATPQPEIGSPTWDYVKRLKDTIGMKLLVKGIVTREDAELAIQNGVDGVYISNHGGRAENSLRPTIQCVPEVAAGVAGRAPILVDGGVQARDGHLQGARARSHCGWSRPAVHVGARVVRATGRRDGARHSAARAAADHAAVRCDEHPEHWRRVRQRAALNWMVVSGRWLWNRTPNRDYDPPSTIHQPGVFR